MKHNCYWGFVIYCNDNITDVIGDLSFIVVKHNCYWGFVIYCNDNITDVIGDLSFTVMTT